MALRNIIRKGDDILTKKSKEVKEINEKIIDLLEDMKDTLYSCGNGIGLAAPQVGILKRIIVIDVGDGLMEIINPVIIEEEGEQQAPEGCLSVPGVFGEVKRPARITVEYQDRFGRTKRVEGDDILARCLSHEIDHLDGVLFTDKVIRYVNVEEESK